LKPEQEAKYMELTWRAKMIGPTLPSLYLGDDRLPSNNSYGFNLFNGDAPCMDWLEKQSISSVVLVSYGTVSNYDTTQLEELGNGLCKSGKPFIWVVRSTEAHKLTEEIKTKCEKMGLIVSWCPQLEVLAHKATGMIPNFIYFILFWKKNYIKMWQKDKVVMKIYNLIHMHTCRLLCYPLWMELDIGGCC
jgi:hypothetical protein